jgi:hypothetical protein
MLSGEWLVERFDSVLQNVSEEKVIERRKGGAFCTTSLGAANECSFVVPSVTPVKLECAF